MNAVVLWPGYEKKHWKMTMKTAGDLEETERDSCDLSHCSFYQEMGDIYLVGTAAYVAVETCWCPILSVLPLTAWMTLPETVQIRKSFVTRFSWHTHFSHGHENN